MTEAFSAKLSEASSRNDSLICVGLDPDPRLMPHDIDVATFNREIIAATADLVCAYKPNFAFYEALGASGWEALRATLDAIPSHVPVIADAKRGDIGNSSAAYAEAVFETLNCDAMTVNAWGGEEGVEPFFQYEDRGIFIWTRSSNASAGDFQDLETEFEGKRMPLWQVMAIKADRWNQFGNIGLVMGATYPAQLAVARALCPEMPFLVPGIGAQEGNMRESVKAGLDARGGGMIINASRSILYASREEDYVLAARAAAQRMRDEVNRYRHDQVLTLGDEHGPRA
jgi:orotidine-5'-phosphate decarboxylase